MKDRFGAVSKVIVILMVALLLCCGFMFLLDSGFNGAVGDWFENNFIHYKEWHSDSVHQYIATFKWAKLKSFITFAVVALVIVWTVTIIVTYTVSRKNYAKKISQNTARLIRDYLLQEDLEFKLHKEYADISQYLTEIKKRYTENERIMLEEVNKKNDLIAYLAHDLKTPLTSIVGYLSLLEEAPDMPPVQKAKYVHIALAKALRLETLINEFFDITRYNLHEIILEKEMLDLGYMLNQMTDEFYPVLNSHGNTVCVKADENICVSADPIKLARVFNNLFKNAIAYSYPDTVIEVKAVNSVSTVQITFTNLGKAIPQRKLEAIFEKFYRLDDARSSNTGGAGLGLAIAKEIVIQHGGNISAVSNEQTTTFFVELPKEY